MDEFAYEAVVDEVFQEAVTSCDHYDCEEPAMLRIGITLGGVHVRAYTCDDHGQMLVEGVPAS